MSDHKTIFENETMEASKMGNAQIVHFFLIWSVRASQAYNEFTAGMLSLYTEEYIRRGLNIESDTYCQHCASFTQKGICHECAN